MKFPPAYFPESQFESQPGLTMTNWNSIAANWTALGFKYCSDIFNNQSQSCISLKSISSLSTLFFFRDLLYLLYIVVLVAATIVSQKNQGSC